jgi:hypothetical protein
VKFAIFSHFVLQTGNLCPNLGCQFPMRNTKWLKNGKLCKSILSAFYNISQRNLGILLILWCSFKLWWNFCLDQNFSYKGKGPLISVAVSLVEIRSELVYSTLINSRAILAIVIPYPFSSQSHFHLATHWKLGSCVRQLKGEIWLAYQRTVISQMLSNFG